MTPESLAAAESFIRRGDGRFVISDIRPPQVAFVPSFARTEEGVLFVVFGDGGRWREVKFDSVEVVQTHHGEALRFRGEWVGHDEWTMEALTVESAQRLRLSPEIVDDLTPGTEAAEIVFANEFPLPR